jgi:hypothetical protein
VECPSVVRVARRTKFGEGGANRFWYRSGERNEEGGSVHNAVWRKEGRGWHWRIEEGGRAAIGENRGGAWAVLLRGCVPVNLGRPERTVAFSIYSKHFQTNLN